MGNSQLKSVPGFDKRTIRLSNLSFILQQQAPGMFAGRTITVRFRTATGRSPAVKNEYSKADGNILGAVL